MANTSWRLVAGVVPAWRKPGVLQIGDVVLRAPTGAEIALRSLASEQGATLAVAALSGGVPLKWLREALLTLAEHQLAERCPADTVQVGVAGSGELAAATLRALGPGTRLLDPAAGSLTSAAARLAARLRQEGCEIEVVETALDADVMVLAGMVGLRTLASELVRADIPHLVVGAVPRGAAVGPFVVPGQTSCQRCVDLVLAGHDRAWPTLAAQLDAVVPQVDRASAAWAGGLAAAHVAAFLGGDLPSTLSASWTLCDGHVELRRWPAHPDCGCRLLPAEVADIRARLRDDPAAGTMAA